MRLRTEANRAYNAAISIHAPAWGATFERYAKDGELTISIHAPAWGATSAATDSREMQEISIHAPAWGATALAVAKHNDLLISIHAPAWGATSRLLHNRHGNRDFNPRTRMGCDGWSCSRW